MDNWDYCVFSIIWKNCVTCLDFSEENMVNLIARMVSMEIVWRLYGE